MNILVFPLWIRVLQSVILTCFPTIQFPGQFRDMLLVQHDLTHDPPSEGSSYAQQLPTVETWHLQKRFLASWRLHRQPRPFSWFCCLWHQKSFQGRSLRFPVYSTIISRQKTSWYFQHASCDVKDMIGLETKLFVVPVNLLWLPLLLLRPVCSLFLFFFVWGHFWHLTRSFPIAPDVPPGPISPAATHH